MRLRSRARKWVPQGEHILPEQLASIALQQRFPDSIVIFDDASIDATARIAREFAAGLVDEALRPLPGRFADAVGFDPAARAALPSSRARRLAPIACEDARGGYQLSRGPASALRDLVA